MSLAPQWSRDESVEVDGCNDAKGEFRFSYATAVVKAVDGDELTVAYKEVYKNAAAMRGQCCAPHRPVRTGLHGGHRMPLLRASHVPVLHRRRGGA